MVNEIDGFLEGAFPASVGMSPDPHVVVLTGAGASAESGIPTFRGPDGYWQVGSTNYRPEQLATRAAFEAMPEHVWAWYLHRRWVCHGAQPNAAHTALADLDEVLGDRFLLVTQNVDGLHLRAGNPPTRVFEIHGNLNHMRCFRAGAGCTREPIPLPLQEAWPKKRMPTAAELKQLRCGVCGGPSRPHVLWFDESYNEEDFRFESTLTAVSGARLFVVVGTAGQTNLPRQMGMLALTNQVPMIVINKDSNPFSEGFGLRPSARKLLLFQQGEAGRLVPALVQRVIAFASP